MTISNSARAALVAAALTAGATVAAGPGFAVATVSKVQDVFVTNTESAPVPTKAVGTTRVDATGQTLTIAGTVDASGSKVDASGSTVTVKGDPGAPPVPVEVTNPPAGGEERIPFQKRMRIGREPGFNFGVKVFAEVPADERLTIEHWSTDSLIEIGEIVISEDCTPETVSQGQVFANLRPASPIGRYTTSDPVTLELDPGSCGLATVVYAREPGANTLDFTATGYRTKLAAPATTAAAADDTTGEEAKARMSAQQQQR